MSSNGEKFYIIGPWRGLFKLNFVPRNGVQFRHEPQATFGTNHDLKL